VVDAGERLHAERLQAALVDDHHAGGAVADLAGVGGGEQPPSEQLDAGDALERGVEADAFVDRVLLADRAAVGAGAPSTGTISACEASGRVAAIAR
jgi:hypothetical protein